MEDFKPLVFVRSLKILRETCVFVRSNGRRLLPFAVGGFLLNLILTALMVNLASPHVNLDVMRPFFELADNSTEPADAVVVVFPEARKEDSTSWQRIVILGELFSMLSTVVAILLFSKACSYNLPEGQHPASFPFSSTWRDCKGLGLLLIRGALVVIIISILLEALDLDDDLSNYFSSFFQFMYLLTTVVSSKEGLYGLSPAEKAWALASDKIFEIHVLGAACFVVQQVLGEVYMTGIFLPWKDEVAAHVIREDTAAEIFRFSVVAALLNVIWQTFLCSVVLTFYNLYSSDHAGRPMRNRDEATAVIAAAHTQPRPEAESVRRGPAASGGSDASSSNGALNQVTRTARPRRQTRPHPRYDPRVWQL